MDRRIVKNRSSHSQILLSTTNGPAGSWTDALLADQGGRGLSRAQDRATLSSIIARAGR